MDGKMLNALLSELLDFVPYDRPPEPEAPRQTGYENKVILATLGVLISMADDALELCATISERRRAIEKIILQINGYRDMLPAAAEKRFYGILTEYAAAAQKIYGRN